MNARLIRSADFAPDAVLARYDAAEDALADATERGNADVYAVEAKARDGDVYFVVERS